MTTTNKQIKRDQSKKASKKNGDKFSTRIENNAITHDRIEDLQKINKEYINGKDKYIIINKKLDDLDINFFVVESRLACVEKLCKEIKAEQDKRLNPWRIFSSWSTLYLTIISGVLASHIIMELAK